MISLAWKRSVGRLVGLSAAAGSLALLGACERAATAPNTFVATAAVTAGASAAGTGAAAGRNSMVAGSRSERPLASGGAGGATGASVGPIELPQDNPDDEADAGAVAGRDAPEIPAEEPGMGTAEDPVADLGKGDGDDVVTIGDSWMLLLPGLGIEVSLERAAKNDYRNYGVPGTRIDAIVDQYADAKAMGPKIQTVVMTAGGNDILQDPVALIDCPNFGMACRAIVDGVLEKVNGMWEQMAKDGVQDVFIIEYSRPQADALGLTPTLQYSTEITEKACAKAPLRCTTIDAAKVFGMHEYISFDNIHPTEEGYELLGEATYEAMVRVGARR